MEYINNSVRKLGSILSSPRPATSLGKRKADSDGDSDMTIDDKDPVPQPQRRKQKATTSLARVALVAQANAATKKAENAVRSAQEVLGKRQPDEEHIQAELDRQHRQEEHGHKSRHKTDTVGSASHPKQTLSTSKPKPSSNLLQNNMRLWDLLSSGEKWATQPNRQARELLEKHGNNAAAMLKSLQEPAYACRDAEIRDGVWKMMDQIEDFAKVHFDFTVDETRLRPALDSLAKETVKIIGCVASGGPAGARGWEDLFLSTEKRQALVCAIIGNVIVEQVFQHMFFGGTSAQIKEVAAIQFEHRHKDGKSQHTLTSHKLTTTGFDRNKLYATKIRSFLASPPNKGKAPATQPTPTLLLPPNFAAHINHTTAALYTHLKPLFTLNPLHPPTTPPTHTIPSLHAVVLQAALLSLHMRLDAHTAYHLSPVFKEQPLTPQTECFNHATMSATRPHNTNPAAADAAVVQIALLPALTAYRLGGWDASPTAAPTGLRARALTQAWVFCRWGVPRAWAHGRPADDEAAHGKLWEGGFVEFGAVLGRGR